MINFHNFNHPLSIIPYLLTAICFSHSYCTDDIDIYAFNNLHLNDRSQLILNAAAHNITIGHDSQIKGDLRAIKSLNTGDRVSVVGSVYSTDQRQIGNQNQLDIKELQVLETPLCELPEFNVLHNDSSLTVEREGFQVIEPGKYGDLTIYERSEVFFKPGEYHFKSIKVFDEVTLKVFENELSTVKIFANDIELGARSTLSLNSYSSLYFKTSFLIDSDVDLIANLYSKEGSLEVRSRSSLKGKIISGDIFFHNEVSGFKANYLKADMALIEDWKEELDETNLSRFQEVDFQLKQRLEGQEGIQKFLDQNALLDHLIYQREEGTVYPLYLIDQSITTLQEHSIVEDQLTSAAIHADSIPFAEKIGVQLFHISDAGDYFQYSVLIEQSSQQCVTTSSHPCWLTVYPGQNSFHFTVFKNDQIMGSNKYKLNIESNIKTNDGSQLMGENND